MGLVLALNSSPFTAQTSHGCSCSSWCKSADFHAVMKWEMFGWWANLLFNGYSWIPKAPGQKRVGKMAWIRQTQTISWTLTLLHSTSSLGPLNTFPLVFKQFLLPDSFCLLQFVVQVNFSTCAKVRVVFTTHLNLTLNSTWAFACHIPHLTMSPSVSNMLTWLHFPSAGNMLEKKITKIAKVILKSLTTWPKILPRYLPQLLPWFPHKHKGKAQPYLNIYVLNS